MARLKVTAMLAAAVLGSICAAGQASLAPSASDPAFRLGPDDVISIRAVDSEELADKQVKIGPDGFISLPTIGRIKAQGLTVEEVQDQVVDRLKRTIVSPDVAVSLVETHSQPVTLVGAVKTPGVVQLQGRRTLLEVLTAAGGPTDNAGHVARITRQREYGDLPLPGARLDESGAYSVADVNLDAIMDARDAAANIIVKPNDLINIPKAQMVYVIGEVLKPGSIVLGEQRSVSVLQAVSLASGITKTAKANQVKVLRLTPGSATRTELVLNLQLMLNGKVNDVMLQPDDILFVPNNLRKELGIKTLDALAGTAATGVIYRLP